MKTQRSGKGIGFHELPLVLFTCLSIAGAGIGSAHLCLGLLAGGAWAPGRDEMALIGSLLATGLAVSARHLGRPLRGPFALIRLGRSALSNEVLVVGLATAASLLAAALPPEHVFAGAVSLGAQFFCLLTLLALGSVYRLPGQLTWVGPVVVQPVVLGLGFGSVALIGQLPAGTGARAELLVLMILLLDGLLLWERTRRLDLALGRGVPSHPRLVGRRGNLLVFRVMLGVLLPAVALMAGRPELTLISLSLNLLLDRALFYGLAVLENTEAGVMRVEAALRAGTVPLVRPTDSSSNIVGTHDR